MRAQTNRPTALSAREREVLFLAAEGLTDKEIALRIEIGPKTVRTYWDRIRAKLGAASRTQALALALRAAYEELATSEIRFRSFVEQMPALFLASNEQGKIVFYNAETARVLGYPPEVFNDSELLLERLYPDPAVRDAVRQNWLKNHQEFAGREERVLTAGGDSRTISWYAHEVSPEVGQGIYWTVGIDITQKAIDDISAQIDQTALQFVVESADQGMWLLDEKFQTRHVNQAMANLLNERLEDLIKESPLKFIAPEDQDAAMTLIRAGGGINVPFRFLRCDGSFIPVRKSLRPIRRNGTVVGYLILATERFDK